MLLKKINHFFQNINVIHLFGLIFLIGLILGTLTANLFRSYYIQDLFQFYTNYLENISKIDVDKFSIFQMAVIHNVKEYLVTFILCITILGIPYIIWRSLYKGFLVGFLLSVATMKYGMMGVTIFLLYIIPHYIFYIPALLITYLKGFEMSKRLYFQDSLPYYSKRKIILDTLPYMLLVFFFMLIGAFLEAYVNTGLIKKIL